MSKRAFFKRYLWLFDVIKNSPYQSFKEIEARFNKSDFKDDFEAGFSKRTFHRDIKEIDDLFGIEIAFDSIKRGYYIETKFSTSNTELLIDSYRFVNMFQLIKESDKYIASEPRKGGSEHLLMMVEAIKKRRKVEFTYRKYVEEDLNKRIIEPYFVKEFKNRWYVVGLDKDDFKVKSFALERIVDEPYFASSASSYDIPQNITPESFFKDSFGIFKVSDAKSEEVELSFQPLKGKFIKSQPLHASQIILCDTETELRIKLHLQITHDFVMELLSHGSEMKVIAPEILKTILINECEKTLKQYKN